MVLHRPFEPAQLIRRYGYAVVIQVQMPCKYHHGTGQTIVPKKLLVEICSPNVLRMEVVPAQESGIARII